MQSIADRLDREMPWHVLELPAGELHSMVAELDYSSLLNLLQILIEKNPFRWLDFVLERLPNVFDDSSSTLKLTTSIIKATLKDTLLGKVGEVLYKIGQTRPREAALIAKRLIDGANEISPYAGYLLVPVSDRDRIKFVKAFYKNYSNLTDFEKTAFFIVLRHIIEKAQMRGRAELILELSLRGRKEANKTLRREAMTTFIALARKEAGLCMETLTQIASNGSAEEKFYLSSGLVWPLGDNDLRIELLSRCSRDTDPRVLAAVANALCSVAKAQPIKTVRILRDWMVGGVDYRVTGADGIPYMLQESNLEEIFHEIASWVTAEIDPAMMRRIPKLIYDIFLRNPKLLVESIGNWPNESRNHFQLWCSTISELLTGISEGKGQDNLLDTILAQVKQVAAGKEVDVAALIKGEEKKLYQAFLLVDELRHPSPEGDFPTIRKTLHWFPAIRNFIGLDWFKKKQKEGRANHPLLVMLTRANVREEKVKKAIGQYREAKDDIQRAISGLMIGDLLYDLEFCQHLDRLLGQFHPSEHGIKHLRNGLTNDTQFYQTVSELELLAALKLKYPTVPEPRVNGAVLDAVSTIEGTQVFFEVITPDTYKLLKFVTGGLALKNRAREKILGKVEDQISKVPIGFVNPVILVMNLSHSEIDALSVEDSLQGSLGVTMYFDRSTGKNMGMATTRKGDKITDLLPEANLVSAILIYKRETGNDGAIHLRGDVLVNPDAKSSLSEQLLGLIEQAILV